MKILVTGANGFLGQHVVRELVSRGHSIRCLVQPGTPCRGLGVDGCSACWTGDEASGKPVIGDLGRLSCAESSGPSTISAGRPVGEADLAPALAGCDAVVHLAALVQEWGPWEPFRRINVAGTRALATAAAGAGVRRFLFMSSLAVHGVGDFLEGTEDAPRNDANNPYARSKIECEDLLSDLCVRGLLETVIIRPGLVPFGEGDVRGFLPLQRTLARGLMPVSGSPDHFTCTVYAGNLAHGVALALESPAAPGRTYVIADDNRVSWREYFEAIARCFEDRFRFLHLPAGPVILAARMCEGIWGLTLGNKASAASARPPVTEYLARLMTRNTRFVSARAKAELGYAPVVGFEEAVEHTCRWAERAGT